METIGPLSKMVDSLRAQLVAKEAELDTAMAALPKNGDLLFFYGDGCTFTKRVAPSVRCLEMTLGESVTRLESWNDEANMARYKAIGGEKRCGGVPFFHNVKTGSTVCGARSCDILTKWAQSVEAVHV